MRLNAIEKPKGWMLRLAYRSSKQRLGKAITPLKVVYARVPKSLKAAYAINTFMESGLSLQPELRLLLQTHGAERNRCGFCVDIAHAQAAYDGETLDKCVHVSDYATDARFTPAERAALHYVEEATETKAVSDETFAELARHFSEQEICEITLVNAVENFYNLVNLPLEIESDNLCTIALNRKRPSAAVQTAH